MRKSNLLFSAVMTLAVGLLAGCSDDLITDPFGPGIVDHDQVRYLNVAIVSPKTVGTRAGDADFDAGTADENKIHSMTFLFYDANGLPTGQVKTLTDAEILEGQITDGSGSVGKIWKSTIPITLNQGENLPAYVLCFVNPMDVSGLAGKSLKDVETITRDEVVRTVDGVKQFPMSNSMYYGTSPQGQTDVRLFATPISTNQLYPSEDAAAREEHVVDIYVERYASRMKLTMGTSAVTANTTAVNGYKLTFVPEYWRPNAIDQNIYIIKRYGIVVGESKNYEPTYAQLLTNFNDRTWWNDASNFRSYWGCSPSYYTNKYPKVSDEITDVAPGNDYAAGRAGYPFDQHYFNYNQIKSSVINGGNPLQKSVEWDAANGFDKVFYARETTSAASTWGYNDTDRKGYNPIAVLPSVVIVGHYQLEKTGGDTYADVPAAQPSFYLYGRTNNKYNLYFEAGIVDAMVKQQNVVLLKKEENGISSYSAYRNAAYFKVEHPSKEVRAIKNTIVAGRHVALQLKSESLPELYYYDAAQEENNRYVRITADNIDKVNSDLLSAGYATKYGEGIAYFNIPVEHLGIYGDDGNYLTGVKEKNNGNKYDFSKCPPGSFGIVRNHTYTIEVSKISGLATALRDKTQPIVPPVEEISYEISARMNILSWRIVPPQQVEL